MMKNQVFFAISFSVIAMISNEFYLRGVVLDSDMIVFKLFKKISKRFISLFFLCEKLKHQFFVADK